jgi:hypothetical protein
MSVTTHPLIRWQKLALGGVNPLDLLLIPLASVLSAFLT